MDPECWCETCGVGYQVADSSASSIPDFCSAQCEQKFHLDTIHKPVSLMNVPASTLPARFLPPIG